jgi:hypothetical protein
MSSLDVVNSALIMICVNWVTAELAAKCKAPVSKAKHAVQKFEV